MFGALAVLIGCSSSPSIDPDAGTAGDGGSTPSVCDEPDRACPAEVPFGGAPCEGALSCPYGSYDAQCSSGAWSVQALCDGVPPGGGCLAPLVEDCDAPFAGTLSGATVTIGPAGALRAFAENEVVPVEHGAQGLSMIRWALHVDGVEVAPECVRARVSFTYEGAPSPEVAQPMTLHCGDTYGSLNILPDRPCEEREYALTMRVVVDGIGEANASLRLMGALCPRTL